jgi:hypothetical protein
MLRNAVEKAPMDGKTFGSRMSLRDHFAGIALQAMIVEPVSNGSTLALTITREAIPDHIERAQLPTHQGFALAAYLLADAMLAERAKVRS